jgi:dTMP kinase
MGKLLVLEGLDGSGKSTQISLLYNHFVKKGEEIIKLSFPDYAEDSSSLIKMYLAGKFSENPHDVNPYAVSSFYACDRFASYIRFWKNDYENDVFFLSDRYTTSNMIYQMAKLPKTEWDRYIDWVSELEYKLFCLPKPDAVLFLDMPPEISQCLLSKRYNGDESKKDVHESNLSFLNECRESAYYAAKRLDWKIIGCGDGSKPLSQKIIHNKILSALENFPQNV